MEEPRKWSWTEFICGWINKRFVSFIVITYFVNEAMHYSHSDEIKKIFLILWGTVTVIWMLSGALEKMVSRGNLNVDVKAGVGK